MTSYKKAVVTFIDILGFGDLVRRSTPEEIERLLKLVDESARPSDLTTEFTGRRSFSFSDTIITSCPFEGPNGAALHGLLYDEIMDVVFLQTEMILRGDIFLRGALTAGEVFHDENMVFGPAVIDAHEIESKLCNFPRVVVDPKVLAEYEKTPFLRSESNTPEEDLRFVKNLIRQDADGLWFVDYLNGMVGNFDEPEGLLFFLKRHKDLILKRASENKKLNSIALKYNWLAAYHNKVVLEFFERRVLSREHDAVFLIEKEELETMHQFRLPNPK